MSDAILETVDFTREFGGFVAVDGVALSVRAGSIHALIGPNGAGKTTCFNLLTAFLPPTRGTIRFKGRNITGMRPAHVARLGLVRSFQISAVFPHLTALENVRLALQRTRGASFDFWRSEKALHVYEDRARELLFDVGLTSVDSLALTDDVPASQIVQISQPQTTIQEGQNVLSYDSATGQSFAPVTTGVDISYLDNRVGIENASEIFGLARHPRSFVSLEGSDHLLTARGQAHRAGQIIGAWADAYLNGASQISTG